jgi:hypothetical protein
MKKSSFLLVSSAFLSISFSTGVYAISDSDIRTSSDTRFCGGSQSNSNVSPLEMEDDGSVYRVGNRRWNDRYEKMFGDFVKNEIDKDFFVEFNIVTDCADAALAVRAIFARIHHLPVSFAGNHYRHTSQKYSRYSTINNWSVDTWKENLRADKRFRKALDDWKIGTGTVNIHADTYQLKVRSERDSTRISKHVRPGAVILSKGHTRFVSQIDSLKWEPVTQLASTVPAKVRPLAKTGMDNIGYYEMENEDRPDRGLLGWNWVINCNGKFVKVRDNQMPYYSPEQNRFKQIYDNKSFTSIIQDLSRARVLKNPQKKDFKLLSDGLADLIEQRVGAVNIGYQAAQRNPQEIMDVEGALYDTYSTPSRDKRLKAYVQNIIRLVDKNQGYIGVDYHIISEPLLDKTIQLEDGKTITYYHFVLALIDGKVSSEPWDTKSKRYGYSSAIDRKDNASQKLEENKNELIELKEKISQYKEDIEDHIDDSKWYNKYSDWAWYVGMQARYLRKSAENKESAAQKTRELKYIQNEIDNTTGKIKFVERELEVLSRLES